MRRSWIYLQDGRVIDKGSPEHEDYLADRNRQSGPLVFGDEPAFVSPIDGKTYVGKAGMREHNAKHDVVNNRDLVGLPYLNAVEPYKVKKGEIRDQLLESAKRKGYMS